MANKFKGCPYPDCDNCPYYDCVAPPSYISRIDRELNQTTVVQKTIERQIVECCQIKPCRYCKSRVELKPYIDSKKFISFCAESFRELKDLDKTPSWCKKRRNRNL